MKITNFSNIKNLDLVFEQDKFNFIYGISGSGKTSITKAMITPSEKLQEFKTFGSCSETIVEKGNDQVYKLFNENSINEYIIKKSGVGIYDVIYGHNEELIEKKNELELLLDSSEIMDVKNIIRSFKEKISDLSVAMDIAVTGTGNINNKKGIMITLNENKSYELSTSDINAGKKNWIKEGYSNYNTNDECPYCSQAIDEEITTFIKKIIDEFPADFGKIISAKNQLKRLSIDINIDEINTLTEQEKLKTKLTEIFKLGKEMDAVLNILNVSIDDDKKLTSLKRNKISKELLEYFNSCGIELQTIMNDLFEGAESYVSKKIQYNNQLQSSIKRNINIINQHIKSFGISYKFEKKNSLSKSEAYSLRHFDSDNDTSQFLSTGEKNIVALIIFVISYQNENLIIDDPASSFDEYRREQILTFILQTRYSKNAIKKTTIVLSHDQIFLKFLTKNYSVNQAYSQSIGKIVHLQNNKGECTIKPIGRLDVDVISEHVRKKLITTDNYMHKILTLRILFEIIDLKTVEYQYLSAILHSIKTPLSAEELKNSLSKKKATEDEILKEIENKSGITLSKYNEKHEEIELTELSKFEQMYYLREILDASKKEERKVLNNIVHFNYALNHMLNPFEYDFQSQNSYEILEANLNI
jgi:energy-coupling factor transporter ATP-binding protein EcfA2